jgi:hypothetical protein
MQLKPRIWLDKTRGVTARAWLCFAREVRDDGMAYQVGWGHSPSAAYEHWKSRGLELMRADGTTVPCN